MSATRPPDAATPLQRAAFVIRDLQARLAAHESAAPEPLAVIGLGCRFPGADGPEAFRALLMNGVDATGEAPAERWPADKWTGAGPGRIASARGGFLSGSPALFDAAFFGIAPREAASVDPQQRLLLEVAWETLEDAGRAGPDLAGSRTGVFVGVSLFDWGWRLMGRRRPEAIDAWAASGVMHSVASGRISFALDLTGPSLSVDTACSSSLVAVHLAARALRARDCDMALAGGVSLMLEPELGVAFSQSRMLAPDGRCKTFSAAADGYGRAEGAGMVALKRLADARRDGDRVIALLLGSAVNQDGATTSLTAPNGLAQQAVIRAALAEARLAPGDVAYVEAHGTGTPLGDPIEIGALGAVFADGRGGDDPLLVGSVKTNIGHAEGAAGIAGFIKTALTLEAGVAPPHLHGAPANPHIDWARGRIAAPARATALAPRGGRLVAGVSAFGFSGTNAHAVLAAPEPARDSALSAERPARPGLLVLSAATAPALAELAERWAADLAGRDPADWASICRTAGDGRARLPERLALVAESPAEAARRLAEGAARRGRAPAEPGGLAFLYTGQGAFAAGRAAVGLGLARLSPAFAARIETVSRLLQSLVGASLEDLLADPARLARRTDLAQPAQFALQVALTAACRAAGLAPDRTLGHSLGEFAAAEAMGVFDVETGLRLLAARGALMQRLVDDPARAPTGMLALSLDARAAGALLQDGDGLVVAAENGPAATVVAGPRAALERLRARLGAEATAQMLDTPVAFHTPALAGVAEAFGAIVAAERLAPARPGFVSALTGRDMGAQAADPAMWARQILAPVRFRDGLETLIAAGATQLVEIGPRPLLLGPARAVAAARAPDRATLAIAAAQPGGDEARAFLDALAQLFVAGRDPDFAALELDARRLSLPTMVWRRERFWIEADAGVAGVAPVDALEPVRLDTALAQTIDEFALAPDAPGWLADHRVGGRAALPLAALVEMLRRSARGDACSEIAELDLVAPVAVAGPGARVQIVVEPAANGARAATLHSRAGADTPGFALNGRARLVAPSASGAQTPDPARAAARATRRLEPRALWARAEAAGIALGPAFRRLTALSIGGGIALARIGPPADGAARPGGLFDPAALDAALQAALALLPEDGATRLPTRLSGCRLPEAAPDELLAVVEAIGGARPTFRIGLFDAQERRIGGVDEVVFARAPAADAGLFHEIRWIEAPLAAGGGLAAFDSGLRAATAAIFAAPDVAAYAAALPALEATIPDRIAAALIELGWNRVEPGFVSTETLAARLAIAPARRRLFAHLLGKLAAAGRLACADAGWRVARLEAAAPPALAQPALAIEIALTDRCGAGLAGVLAGRIDPLDLLFPGRSLDDATRLYAGSAWSQAMTRSLSAALAAWIAARGDAPLRVLEVGGGTAATTAAILDLFPAGTGYVFTDVSPLFLRRAEERFGARPGFVARLLDLEAAGAAPDLVGFDLIVAANVVHATADLRASLAGLAARLAPGGALALVEGTGPLGWGDLTFGLTDGWWRFHDADVRPDHPTPPLARWRDCLAAAGFDEIVALDSADHPAGRDFRQAALLARRAPTLRRVATLGSGPAFDALTAALAQGGASLVAADAPADALLIAGEPDPAGLADPAGATTALASRLAPVLAGLDAGSPPAFIVTAGALQVEADGGLAGAVSRALEGLTRAVAAERPEVRLALVDLDPAPAAADLDHARREVAAWRGERLIALRGGRRHVARLAEAAPVVAGPQRLAPAIAGQPASLAPRPFAPAAPGPGEIEVETVAVGLNFRDALIALGLYPEAGELGRECFGRVLRVGAGVTAFRPGDRVFGLGEATLANHALLSADHALPAPPGADAAECAAQLVAWATALHALEDLARLRPGERVLIHAGASGTGLACLRLARALGAEAHVTASAAKQALARAEGAASVHDSRSPAFTEGVRGATGGRGVDVVVDALTGPGMLEASLAAAAPGARFVELARLGAAAPADIAARRPDIAFHPVDLARESRERPQLLADLARRAGRALAEGRLAPLPVRRYPFERAGAALRAMQEGRQTGRLAVVRPPAPRADAGRRAWLVTGAFGGVGRALAGHLAASGRAGALLLVGRRPPDAETAGEIARLGARLPVLARVADVADRAAMTEILAQCGADLPLLGAIVHAAGALDDAPLEAMTPARIAAVTRAKLGGGWLLHDLTRDLDLDHFALFSSAVGALGNAGQANHALAGAGLDGLAAFRRAQGLPAIALDWGVWGETGAATRGGRAGELARRGFRPMSTAAALAAFDRALDEDRGQTIVAALDYAALAARIPGDPFIAQAEAKATSVAPAPVAVDWRALPGAAARAALLEAAARATGAVLGLAPETIDPQARFFEIGMDSLTAVELRHRLTRELGVDLPATLAFDYPSPAAVADFVLAGRAAPPAAAAPAPEPENAGAGVDDADLLALADRRLADIEDLIA